MIDVPSEGERIMSIGDYRLSREEALLAIAENSAAGRPSSQGLYRRTCSIPEVWTEYILEPRKLLDLGAVFAKPPKLADRFYLVYLSPQGDYSAMVGDSEAELRGRAFNNEEVKTVVSSGSFKVALGD